MKIQYMMKFSCVPEHQMDLLQGKIRPHFLGAIHLKGLRTNLAQLAPGLEGLGKQSWFDLIMMDRLTLIYLWITTKSNYGMSLRENLNWLQFQIASKTPLLEYEHVNEITIADSWIMKIAQWMAINNIQL